MKTWFITGASRGFGREWTIAALERGDRVAATARTVSTLDDLVSRFGDALLPIALDVDDREADFAAVALAHRHFGRLDVVVNNAGYGHFGFLEEASEADIRGQFETNVFGAMWISQAALPLLRAQGAGHIIQVSSMGGVSASPMLGIYNASKWALEGFSQALALETASLGITVTIVEPGGFDTDWADVSAAHSQELPAYRAVRESVLEARLGQVAGRGSAAATSAALLEIVDAPEPPLRVFFGSGPLGRITTEYAARLALWQQWQPVSVRAQG